MLTPAILGQTITVVDKSNKVVGHSKHLLNVFKEAKYAYQERKAEIIASHHANTDERLIRKALQGTHISERPRSVHRSSSHCVPPDPHHRKPISSRRSSNDGASSIYPSSNRRFEQDLHSPTSPRSPRSPGGEHSLSRRHTDFALVEKSPQYRSAPPSPTRSRSAEDIDMHLAYGELPMDLMETHREPEVEVKTLVGTVKRLLQEADCVGYSVTHMIAHLQKNPEAMAAVALTLAEISNVVSKLSPGAVMALKGSAPAVFALLASPQFLIAAGLGVGVTIVMFGGYKIIKKIKAKKAAEEEQGVDEMIEVGGELSRIENWRRGISEAAESSVGTSVEGEFITPMAARSRVGLHAERVRESKKEAMGLRAVGSETGGDSYVSTSKPSKSSRGSKTEKESRTSRSERKSKEGKEKKEKKEREKKAKKPSPLRMMFT